MWKQLSWVVVAATCWVYINETARADMRGQVVCGVAADEAVIITWKVPGGLWRIMTPSGIRIPTFNMEEEAIGLWEQENPVFVCPVRIMWNLREYTGKFYRLGRSMKKYKKTADTVFAGEEDPRMLVVGIPADSGAAGAPTGSSGIRVGETVAFDGMEFVGIPPGEFLMGSTSRHAHGDEHPVTRVRISKGFYLGKYEVTQAEWQAVMGSNPSQFSGCGRCPVEQVSWEDVQVFIGRLNARSGGGRYRLPTDAEWEYAARAGTTTDTYAGDITERLGNDPVVNGIAWYLNNSGDRTHPVGQKAANPWGLHDMLGSVWELVGDWYGDYSGGAVTDPTGPASGSTRVHRGGSWYDFARSSRSSSRYGGLPGDRDNNVGFRLLRTE